MIWNDKPYTGYLIVVRMIIVRLFGGDELVEDCLEIFWPVGFWSYTRISHQEEGFSK